MKNYKFLKKLLVLALILIASSPQMWGISTYSSNVYFDGTDFGATYVKFVYWQDKSNNNWYIKTTLMTKLGNTNLYYVSSPDCSSWSPAISYYSFLKVAKTSDWGDQETSWSNFTTYASTYTAKQNDWNFGGYYQLFKGATSSSGCSVSGSYATTYSALTDREHTLVVKVSTNGGSTYSNASNSPAKVSVSSYKMDDWNSCATETSASIALNATTVSEDFTACYRANTTLKAENISSDYDFVGWYDATNEEYISTDALPSTWNPKDAITLEARFKKKQFTVSYGVNSSTRYGSITLNSGSSVSTTSSSTLNIGTSLSFTASPSSGYQVEGWYSDAACTAVNRLQSGGTSYDAGTLTAAKTVYVKFAVRTGGVVTLNAGTGGQVSLDNSNWGASKTKSSITTNTAFNIYAQPSSGYTFNAWTKNSGSGSITSTSSASTSFTPVAYEDATVTASFTETKVTLTPTVSYDHGSSNYTASSSNTVGVATTTNLSCSAPNAAHYTFAGWTLTNLTVTSGNAASDRSITVKIDDPDGETPAAVANYNEVLTTSWYIAGATGTNYPFTGWGTSGIAMSKKSGHSTEEIYYCNITVNRVASGNEYEFQTYNHGNTTYYGYNNKDIDKEHNSTTVYSNNPNNMRFKPYVTGTYEFKVDNTGANPVLTVTWPVFNQVRISAVSPGTDATNVGNFDMSDPVSNVRSVTRSLAAGKTYTFKIMYNSDWYGYDSGTFTRSTYNSSNSRTISTSGGNMTLTTDYAGDYTFKFNESTKALVIEFPEAYQATFTKSIVGTDNGTISAPTASYNDGATTVTSATTWIPTGTEVAFAADDAETGYTWKGWYSVANPSADYSKNQLEEDKDYSATISAATTIYAVYAENKYTITVNDNGDGGSTTVSSLTNVGIATASSAVTANPTNAAWRFKEWQYDPAKISFATGSATTATVTVNAINDEGATLTAIFEPRYGLYGSYSESAETKGGMPGWTTSADFAVTTFSPMSLNCTRTLEPNTWYRFQVYDREADKYRSGDSDTEMTANASWTLTGENKQIYYKTAGYGNYRFEITAINGSGQPSIHIIRPTSHEITFGTLTSFNEGASSTDDGTGGSISVITTENDPDDLSSPKDYTIYSGDSIRSGGTAVFTATAQPGYTFAGWYTDAACTQNKTMTNPLTVSTISANVARYAKFTENMTTVSLTVYMSEFGHGSITIDDEPAPSSIKVGVHTKYTVKAVPARGYYFEGWALSPATPDFAITGTPADDENDEPEVSGLGGGATSGQVLEANFHDLDKIYFKNWDETANEGAGGPLWDVEHVYVYFNVDWKDDGEYAGVKNMGTHAEMELNRYIGDNVFEAYVPHSFTKSGNGKVAFFDSWQGDAPYAEGKTAWDKSFGGKGVYRTDYNKALDMFVPEHTSMDTKNSTTYYSNGYWRSEYISTYRSGYYLKRRKSNNTYWQMGEFKGEDFGRDKNLIFSLRVDNTSADSCKYRIVSAGGENYVAASAIDNTGCTDIQLNVNNTNDSYFTITPTVEGDYLITIDQSGEKMKISVNYPIAVGDYRLKHSYNDGTAKTSYSDIIKSYQAADDTVSMFIYAVDANTDGTIDGSLVLQECTAITDGKPTWSAGNAVSAYTLANFSKKPGVYKFAVVINTTSHTVTSATEIDLYTGNFYIKTDGAEGEWVRYKVDPDNIMRKNEINFNAEDASSFNYYFCHYYSKARNYYPTSATNLKCVIANDYNNAVSDTLVGDDILGTYEKDAKTYPHETLPYEGSVRFSYNSLTNELKRTYLNGSSYSGESFLYLVTDDDNYIFTSTTESSSTDVHDITEGDCKFTDDQNWTYELLVHAYPMSTAGVKTTYDSHVQTLVAKDHPLIGGADKGGQKYPMKLVYDFKTNYIMSAFTPAGAIADQIKEVDVLLVRHAQEAATTITFSGSGSLDAQKVIGALRFNNAEMRGNVGSWNEYTRPYLKYFISFPFDVRVRDIFGINSDYGDAYVVSRYAGDKRAEKGFFRGDGTSTFWEELTIDSVMHANEGYVVILDNDYFNGTLGNLWAYSPTDIYMYFPSTATIGAITPNETVTINVPQHECKINRTFVDSYTSQTVNHKYTDTDWNLMGVPVFTTVTGDKDGSETYDPGKLFVMTELDTTKAIQYFYKWDYDNEFDIVAADGYEFKPMHSYMVQYHGSVTFKGTAPTPASVAARRTPEVKKNYRIELQALDMNEKMINRTYVELRENACDTFALNEDVYMSPTNRAINIFTFAGNYDVAANVLSIYNHIIPVGVNVRTAGSFTFTMPSNFDGTVTLIDTYTDTRTNLAMGDYTVNLPKGYNSDRFQLEININKTPTAIDGAEDGSGSLKDGKAHKFIENGVMYIIENGRIYDAQGNRVK